MSLDHAASGPLMLSRRFAPLFWTQFLGAFNDNFLKNAIVFLILFKMTADQAAALVTLAGAIFMAPFLFLSALGGQLADKFDKAVVARRLKFAEIGAAVIGMVGLALGSLTVMMLALFLFGVVSALFGPIKYGILPDHLAPEELPKANAWVEAATFIAILAGTIASGLAATAGLNPFVFGPLLVALAVACWATSRLIPRTGPAAPGLRIDPNVFRSTVRLLSELRQDRRIWAAGFMSAWFWLAGAIMLSVLPVLVRDGLGGGELAITTYLAVFAVAIAAGSAAGAWFCHGRLPLVLAPLSTLAMALFGADLALLLRLTPAPAATAETLSAFFAGPATIHVAVDLAGLALAGGLLVVPTFAAVQHWAQADRRARVVAAVNVLSAGLMTLGGVVVAAAQALGAGLPAVLAGLAVLNVAAAVVMLRALPTNPLRDIAWLVMRLFHRLDVTGLENLDAAGEAPILALNHVSFLDAPLALTLGEREPVFAIDATIAKAWWVRPFLRFTRAMPLDPSKPMATRTLIKAVREGHPLVIFPEGRLTVTGSLMKVYDGAAMVADKTGAKVVPIRIDGLERSPFSRLKGRMRRTLFPKVRVTILPPVTLKVPDDLHGRKRRVAAGAALYGIMSDLVFQTTPQGETVLERVIRRAKRDGMGRLACEDPITGALSCRALLAGAAVLARRFHRMFPEEDTIGVMLPTSNGAAVTLLGLQSAGKVPAMLNFTAGAANVLAACRAAEVRTILSSRAFVSQARLSALVEEVGKTVRIVWLDDLRQTIGRREKLAGLLRATRPLVRRTASDRAVILFTSGSEGTPKGVVLTHRNVLANVAQAAARIDFGSHDKVFNVLPVFHSFGLTAGTILPLTAGVPVYFYPSPLHYRIVPELIYGADATILFGTDTFLAGYARTAHPYDFRSLRYIFAGAEPVKDTTRRTYAERFGIRILEGYGVTEAAPVAALNTPMYNKPGTVGKLMPGMEARLEVVPGVTEGGRLFIRGPNVMAGYLRAERPGVLEAPPDGWHDTGDVVTIDADGFIAIKGRAKRFAKIGGEMVSLAAVEQLAEAVWPGHLSAVAAVPDERKGERLVLLTDKPGASRAAFVAAAKAAGAQDLMIPAEVRPVAALPLLGSGKIDHAGVRRLVEAGGPTPSVVRVEPVPSEVVPARANAEAAKREPEFVA